MINSTSLVEVHQLEKKYSGAINCAVKKISFSICDGDIFGILGPNGAGKTTTLSIICGLIKPSSGTVTLQGFNHNEHHETIKKFIGVVPQDIALYPTLTAFENLRYFGNMYGLRGPELGKRINDYLSHFGLSESSTKQVRLFSGGMKRRVNLIAGILHQPKILFLDEPTVGVDVQSRNLISEFLKDFNKKGTTIVYTSHHMEEAQHLCNKIIIIDGGNIISSGSPNELVKENSSTNLEDLFLKLTGRNVRD